MQIVPPDTSHSPRCEISSTSYQRAMNDYEELYHFCSTGTYPTGFSKNEKRALRRKCQGRFKVERGCLYHRNKADWMQVPRDSEHVQGILESCHSSLEANCYNS